jgi:uracil-DNA glycosylase
MRWTERQRAMLREMGVLVWSRELATIDAVPAPAASVAASARAAPPALVQSPPPSMRRSEPALAIAPALAPADWLVVGEAFDAGDPQQEQLLDNMLRAIGITRSAPARACRAAFVALGDPDPLAAAIEAVAPRCIVALGRAAATAVLGSDAPLGNWRGRCHERGALPVVVTFSLAFLLRHPADKAKAWADLCLAVGAAAAPAADARAG